MEKDKVNDWLPFPTNKIPKDETIKIELLFDTGEIVDYDYSPWPWALVTHWRFKKQR